MIVNETGSLRFLELLVISSQLCIFEALRHFVRCRRYAAHLNLFHFSCRQKLGEGGCFSKLADVHRRVTARRQLILFISHVRVDEADHWRLVGNGRWRFPHLTGASEALVRPVVARTGPLTLLAGADLVDL